MPPKRGEKRVLMDGMTWADYDLFWQAAERRGGYRVSYLDGQIELMFPSYDHELRKSRLGGLLEAYCHENEVDFFEHGSTTIREELKAAGKEPDESYCFAKQKKFPDLIIEVAITSGGIDTLEIYRRWAIPEVGVWQRDKLNIFLFKRGRYQAAAKSLHLPALDLDLLASCASIQNGLQARKKFLAGVKK